MFYEIPGCIKFKKRPFQNEDGLKVLFGNITNDEQDHWNHMSSKPTVPLRQDVPVEVDNPNDGIDEEQPIGGNNVFHAKDEVEEVSSATDDAKKGSCSP